MEKLKILLEKVGSSNKPSTADIQEIRTIVDKVGGWGVVCAKFTEASQVLGIAVARLEK